ncbi:MAG TPA: DoxX family protein [Pyrinomonadaceae bacterium]|nr:DoxX family protein [Pyrinomonadaceae bacterium]
MTPTNKGSFFDDWTPRILSVLRIVAAFLFMAHGAQKLFGFLAPPGAPTPPLMSQMGIGGVLEFFGGLLLLLGLFTRPVAFILSGMMAVAYFQAHAPKGFWPLQNRGELAVLYCFLFLFFAVAGGGEWSLDRLLRRRDSHAPGERTGERA